MGNTFILNHSLTSLELIDAIYEKISKLKAISFCLFTNKTSDMPLKYDDIYEIADIINDYICELGLLFTKLNEKYEKR